VGFAAEFVRDVAYLIYRSVFLTKKERRKENAAFAALLTPRRLAREEEEAEERALQVKRRLLRFTDLKWRLRIAGFPEQEAETAARKILREPIA